MRRILLKVAYDGTAFHGWAFQEGVRTVCGTLLEGIEDLTGERVELEGASRTDAGVHALMNIAVFDTGSTIPPDKFYAALNTRLPEDVRITGSQEVEGDFSIRKAGTEKTYCYTILNSEHEDPTRRLYSYYVNHKLDESLMSEASKCLVGKHDFRSFCSVHTQALTTVREITGISVKRAGDVITVTVSGMGFLYNMVRIIAGTLIEVGKGRFSPDDVSVMLNACDRLSAGPTAPPQGLCLMEIRLMD